MSTHVRFADFDCKVVERAYNNGRVRWDLVDATDGSPVACATVNLQEVYHEGLDDGSYVLIKDWSENTGIIDALMKAGFIDRIEKRIPTGFVWAALCKRSEHGGL